MRPLTRNYSTSTQLANFRVIFPLALAAGLLAGDAFGKSAPTEQRRVVIIGEAFPVDVFLNGEHIASVSKLPATIAVPIGKHELSFRQQDKQLSRILNLPPSPDTHIEKIPAACSSEWKAIIDTHRRTEESKWSLTAFNLTPLSLTGTLGLILMIAWLKSFQVSGTGRNHADSSQELDVLPSQNSIDMDFAVDRQKTTSSRFCSFACLATGGIAMTVFALSWMLSKSQGIVLNLIFWVVLGGIAYKRRPSECARRLLWSVVMVSISGLSISGLDIGLSWGEDRFLYVVTNQLDWVFFASVSLLAFLAILVENWGWTNKINSPHQLSSCPSNSSTATIPMDKPGPTQTVYKFAVSVDLAGYSDAANAYDQHANGSPGVAQLNNQIKEMISTALVAKGLSLEGFPSKMTGDGALIAFDQADQVHEFAEELLLASERFNRGKDIITAQRHFRIGAYAGEVDLEDLINSQGHQNGYELHSKAISYAVRLESQSVPGEVLIDLNTWADLSAEYRVLYGVVETIKGKRDEIFEARRRRVVAPPTTAAVPKQEKQAKAINSNEIDQLGQLRQHRNEICRRLVQDWRRLANEFQVPPHDRAAFRHGWEPDDLWDWVEMKKRLAELPEALKSIERQDLFDVIYQLTD